MNVDDHVKLTSQQTRIWGGGYRAGTVGIVRATSGLLATRVTIELVDGTLITVDRRDLRRIAGSGDAAFERRRTWHKSKRLASFLFWFPAAVAVAVYVLCGGDPVLLALGVVEAAISTVLSWVTGPYGVAVAAILVVVVWRRGRA